MVDQPMPREVRVHPNIPYLDSARSELLDVYEPEPQRADELRPAMVVIHGGGWFAQAKDGKREQAICRALAEQGFVCASVDYRLVNFDRPEEAQAVWPVNVQDCKTAVRFLRKRADDYGIDSARIGAIGGSAGGHLAAMLGCTSASGALNPPGKAEDYAVQAAVCMYGLGDVARWVREATVRRKGMDALELMLGGSPDQVPEKFAQASPVSYADQDAPPVLLVHGTADDIIPFVESEQFAGELRAAGTPHQLITLEGGAHSFDLQPPQRDLRPEVIRFLRRSFGQE